MTTTILADNERTTSAWYDQLRDGNLELLHSEVNTVMCHPARYESWQISAIRSMAQTNGDFSPETIDTLTELMNNRSKADRQAKAAEHVNTPAKLRKRLMEARSVLVAELRAKFTPADKCRLDVENKRLYCIGETHYIAWKNTGETTVGSCSVYRA